jgi:hypothetical protein
LCGLESASFADVAQLVEHWLPKPGVAGSNPVVRSSEKPRTRGHSVAVRRWLSEVLQRVARRLVQNRAVQYTEGESTLREMLSASDVDLDNPDPLATWAVFKEFAARPVEGVDPEFGDMFLFQWGVYDWRDGNGERFEIDFLRQFSVNTPDGEYDHMEQLHCTFYFDPTDDLRAFDAGDQWLVGDLDAGLAELESLPVFAVLRDRLAGPVGSKIEQEQV